MDDIEKFLLVLLAVCVVMLAILVPRIWEADDLKAACIAEGTSSKGVYVCCKDIPLLGTSAKSFGDESCMDVVLKYTVINNVWGEPKPEGIPAKGDWNIRATGEC